MLSLLVRVSFIHACNHQNNDRSFPPPSPSRPSLVALPSCASHRVDCSYEQTPGFLLPAYAACPQGHSTQHSPRTEDDEEHSIHYQQSSTP